MADNPEHTAEPLVESSVHQVLQPSVEPPAGPYDPALQYGARFSAVPPTFAAGPPRPRRERPTMPHNGWMVVAASTAGFILCGRTVFAGLAGTLFVVGLVCALVLSGAVRRRIEPLLWLGLACALGVALSFRASPWLITLNMVAICALLLMGVLCANQGSLFRCTASGVEEAVERLVGSWFTSPALLTRAASWVKQRSARTAEKPAGDGTRSMAGSAARSLLLAIPVLVVVIPLLSAGDAAFAGMLGSVGDAIAWVAAGLSFDASVAIFGVLGVWIGVTLLVIAGAHHRAPFPGSNDAHRSGSQGAVSQSGETERGTKRSVFVREVRGALWIVNVTLAAFAASQVATAAGLADRLQSDPLSYQEIAKDGFFPLLVASAFVLCALLVAHLMLGTNRWERRCVVAAQSMICLNLLVVVVASRRLWVGADVWGLTMLRVCSQSAALLLGVMLISVAVWQHRPTPHQPIVGVSVVGAVAILLVLNVLPVEQYIVNWNADRPAADFAATADTSAGNPLDRRESKELGVARCSDYYDKWHGLNADAMPAFAPLIAHQLRAGRIDRNCQQTVLHCDSKFDVGGIRWNFAKARANREQSRWCSAG